MQRFRIFSIGVAALSVLASLQLWGAEKPPVDVTALPSPVERSVDFIREIKPLFESSCYSCHGPEKQKSGFRLDLKTDALKGGELGPAIIPGKGADSPLVRYVAGLVADMQMPPKGEKLSRDQIAILRAWIDQGAAWPAEADESPAQEKSDFWSFQPAHRPRIPDSNANRDWPRNPIDQFILAKLAEVGLKPSSEADRITLIRRLSFNLRGLPPDIEEVDAFVSDQRPDAYERLVDRYLDSAQYGERWGRHWLDVVHYGESHGYDKDKPRLNAWPYRDYVIRAFNEDRPYSRFIQEQLAGDVLFPEEPDGVIATGFIAAGPWDFVGHVELPESKTDGLIARYNDRDDMVMTAMSTFQSLTVHCARCHDHKFDPISLEDYYSLQAVFAGVDRADRPFDTDREVFNKRIPLLEERRQLESRRKALDAEIAKVTSPEIDHLAAQITATREELRKLREQTESSPSNGYHSAIEPMPHAEKWVEVDLGSALPIDRIKLIPARPTDFPDTPGFGFPKRFRLEIGIDGSERVILADHTRDDFPNPGNMPFQVDVHGRPVRFIRVVATELWPRTDDYVFALAELVALSGTNNVARSAIVQALDSIEGGRWGQAKLVDGFDSRKPLDTTTAVPELLARRESLERREQEEKAERQRLVDAQLSEATKREFAKAKQRLEEINRSLDALPKPQWVYAAARDFARNGSFVPPPGARPVQVLQRGDVKRPLRPAAPGTLAFPRDLPSRFEIGVEAPEGERRAALAKWLTDSKNFLTRRSIVNRVWHYHFGRGIVDTPNDFGHMGSLPTHPELLDWLAYWFQDNGESFKALHRLILTSATYRQSSQHNAEAALADSDNRYLWRMNRQRLDAETLRDSVLAINGMLDPKMGGPSVQQFIFKDDHSPVYDYTQYDVDAPGAYRRSIYRFLVRSVPDPFMDCLDSADPSLLTPKRNTTLTALQALATMNNPFMVRQAEHFAARVRAASDAPADQIRHACRLALNRSPRPDELDLLVAYTEKHGITNTCRLILNSNEFLFVD